MLLTTENLKNRAREWIIDDSTLIVLSGELNKLSLTESMSESAIEQRIAATPELLSLIKNIKPVRESNTIIQSHSGTGDNVGRDKIIN